MTYQRQRVVIENLSPAVDCGRFPAKRIAGETVRVSADVFADGHDAVSCLVLYKGPGQENWEEVEMQPLVNDRWQAEFRVTELGVYTFTVEGWVDGFKTWQRDLKKRVSGGQDTTVDLRIGADLLNEASQRASGVDAEALLSFAKRITGELPIAEREQLALQPGILRLADRYPDRRLASRFGTELRVLVERTRAGFSSWYELFPRSFSSVPGAHGTFADVEKRLDAIASMGFDVLYFPPIHPIGTRFRKGRNNRERAEASDVGSPWAIGAEEGGHKAIHPALGTLEDFRRLVKAANAKGIEIALDIAYQCAPDHPYVKNHPEWFRKRPDGSIQYAENPPKKYQDIYPIFFENEDWKALWEELRSVILYWIEQGVRIFRVDNPHTKAFPYWEWMISTVHEKNPDIIFLSEAFTRPKVMYRLAKAGFTQSYTYFTWRNTKAELIEYFTELTNSPVREFFRPNLWPNTPDILPEVLQIGGRPAFLMRLALAATLGANYGIYGPAFELGAHVPREHGSEEYLDSEKYEIKRWQVDDPNSLQDIITMLNRARNQNPALQSDRFLHFHAVDNDMLLCYSKATEDKSNVILTVVNLDFRYRQSGWVYLDLDACGLPADRSYMVHDLLSGASYSWYGPRNYVELDPHRLPVHVFRIENQSRTEPFVPDYRTMV